MFLRWCNRRSRINPCRTVA